MTRNTPLAKKALVVCIGLLGLCLTPTYLRGEQKRQALVPYEVITNSTERDQFDGIRRRTIQLLIAPADFTEPNLLQLMSYFLKKYQRPDEMSVYIYTHPDQSAYLNRYLPGAKYPQRDDAYRKYPHGGFWRRAGNAILRYMLPPSGKWKTVVVKGKDNDAQTRV